MDRPPDPRRARRLIREILASGEVSFSKHALEEMEKDDLTTQDCINVLRAGIVGPAELEKGTWRYRVHGGWIWVVTAF